MNKIKIYTNLNLLKEGYPVELLIPYIGTFNEEDKPGKVLSERFIEFMERGKDLIELTTLEDADVILLPVYYRLTGDVVGFEKAISAFVQEAEKTNKKIIVFAGHDVNNPPIRIKNAIIFNSAVNKSTQPKGTYSWPHFFEDFIKTYQNNVFTLREKPLLPVIGFCGYAPPLTLNFGKAKLISIIKLLANYLGIIKKFPSKASHSYRARAVIGLLRSNKIKTNFIVKPNFAFGPTGQLNTGKTSEKDADFRKKFVNNIVDSDYTLCVRGIGNNSIRFFESLCCGRIPVFVDTDCVLPFDFIINWKELCVWVEEKDIDKTDMIVANFHKKISNEEFIALQKKLRSLWLEYFSPIGFFGHLNLFLTEY